MQAPYFNSNVICIDSVTLVMGIYDTNAVVKSR